MKNKLSFVLSLLIILFGSAVYADGILSEPIQKQWYPVIGLGGGISSTTNLGRSQTFPIINPVTDEYYVYSPQSGAQTKGLFEAFLGAEHPIFSTWLLQGGIAYTQTGSDQINGSLVQGADALSADQYTYKFNAITRQILAQAKLMQPWHDKFYPYFLLGLGASFNSASNFSTSVPPFLTFTREYQNNQSISFAYRVGVGIDVDISQHVRLGVAYRFVDLGSVNLGSASIDNVSVLGKLSQSNLYANEALIQLTYII